MTSSIKAYGTKHQRTREKCHLVSREEKILFPLEISLFVQLLNKYTREELLLEFNDNDESTYWEILQNPTL